MSDTMIMMLVMLAAELVLLLLVLLAAAWFRGRAARRRDERAIRLLVTRIRNSRAERETGIERFLDERMGLSGAELAQAKQALLQSELVLLKRFAEVYRGRDADAAARFDADLVTALTPYHELKTDNVVVASEAAPADNSELERLREQNRLLSNELSGNMETMSKMVREFSTMFAESSGDAAAATPAATTEPSATPAAVEGDVEGAVRSDSAAASESSAADESAGPDPGTPDPVAAQFAEAGQPGSAVGAGEVSESVPTADEPVSTGVPEVDTAREANAESQDKVPPQPVATAQSGLAAEGVSGMKVAPETQTDAVSDAPRDDAEAEMPLQPKVQVEAGDDLDRVAERLEEEGPAEVVTFDDPEGDADTPEEGEGFDAVDEAPLKAQSQG